MKNKWQKKEINDAKDFGAKQTIRSGGLWFSKGDSKSDDFLIENKTTDKESFSIKAEIWEKISKEALLCNRVPMLSIEFGKKSHEIVVLDKGDFIEILNKIKK